MNGMERGSVLIVDGESRIVSSLDVGLQSPMWRSGASLFETMLVRREGRFGLAFLDEHVERLARSAKHLGWTGVPAPGHLKAWAREAAFQFRQVSLGLGRLRITVAWTRSGPPVTSVLVVPYEPPRGAAAAWVTRVRLSWGLPFPMPKSGSRLLYDLAESEARRAGAEEGLLVDPQGAALEGARSNLFLVREGELVTPPLSSGVLPGVARGKVIELAKDAGIAVREAVIAPGSLREGDELFLTNALWGVRPVAALNGSPLPPGKLAAAFREMYERAAQNGVE